MTYPELDIIIKLHYPFMDKHSHNNKIAVEARVERVEIEKRVKPCERGRALFL